MKHRELKVIKARGAAARGQVRLELPGVRVTGFGRIFRTLEELLTPDELHKPVGEVGEPNCDRCCDTGIVRVEDNGPGEPACTVPCNCRTAHLSQLPHPPAQPTAQPLVILGPGGDFTQEVRG